MELPNGYYWIKCYSLWEIAEHNIEAGWGGRYWFRIGSEIPLHIGEIQEVGERIERKELEIDKESDKNWRERYGTK